MGRVARCLLTALLAGAVVAGASAALVGCSGAQTGAPGGVHSGTVSQDTYVAVVKALKAYGIAVTSESDLRMTYGSDRDHVTVTGGGMQIGSKASTTTGTVASVNLELVGKTWRVLNVTGNY